MACITPPSSSDENDPWVCHVCGEMAIDSGKLDIDFVVRDDRVVFDADDTPWVYCIHCHKYFHVRCIDFDTVEIVIFFGIHYVCVACRQLGA